MVHIFAVAQLRHCRRALPGSSPSPLKRFKPRSPDSAIATSPHQPRVRLRYQCKCGSITPPGAEHTVAPFIQAKGSFGHSISAPAQPMDGILTEFTYIYTWLKGDVFHVGHRCSQQVIHGRNMDYQFLWLGHCYEKGLPCGSYRVENIILW